MEPINTNLDPSHPRPVISTWRSTPCTTVRPCPTSSCQTPATMTWRDPLLTSQGGCCTATTRCQGASLLVTSTPAGWTPGYTTTSLALSLTASTECPTACPDSPPLPGPGPTLGLGKLLRVWLVFTPTIFIQSFSEESLYIIYVYSDWICVHQVKFLPEISCWMPFKRCLWKCSLFSECLLR